ncbi:glycosyltransferase family 2 protein [Infirmifilum lucidum]|uniref:Glycosyltransferase family 2 protein n=1 Tax=Infirmifilum lucidum TaxID=2776706 RepID=A0A7L9FFY3_9CREN|nr:glycosyltransferase family 2 protein [Infirmifilum lucidum]QOJ78521.1 glycosyltransferase family 2 protein [Infirmifilum lucidum]
MPLVSVVITAHREAENLEELLDFFTALSARKSLEVIVSVDEPGEKLRKIIEAYSGKAVFSVSEARRGKVRALNDALSLSRGEIILFLDSDVRVEDPLFLERLESVMEKADVAEIKKLVPGSSIIGKLVYYDYLTFGVASYIFDRRVGLCAGLNGAAFAFRRAALKELGGFKNSVLEDMDIGFRSFFLGLRYKYFYQSAVIVDPPTSILEWVNQRLRWSTGAWLWVKEYMFLLLGSAGKHSLESAAAILVMFPWIVILPVVFLSYIPGALALIITAWHLALSLFASLLPLVYIFETVMALLPPQVFFTLPYFLLYCLSLWVVSRRIGYRVNPLWLTLYFFFYSPIWLSIMFAGFIRVFVLRRKDVRGWKL